MTGLDALLDGLPRTTLVVGKGGVGKTTCAAGIAAQFANRGQDTLVLSTDPAAALASVIGAPVSTQALPIHDWPHLYARQLAAGELRGDFLARWRDTIAEIVDRGTYLDRAEVDGIVDASLPGVDEIFALLALADLLADSSGKYGRIVVDTAPTGHTLRLLALPETFSALVAMLDLMQGKHRFMVRALTRRYQRDRADEFLAEMRARVDGLRAALADAASVAAVVVARDETVVLAETHRYVKQLRALHVHVAAVIMNASQTDADFSDEPNAPPIYRVGRQSTPPVGLASIVRAMDARSAPLRVIARAPRKKSAARTRAHATSLTPASCLVRTLTIVGGKGGVGKSTVACALAVAAVDADGLRTLLVSTDPAPSIADALGEAGAPWAQSDREHELDDPRRLVVRQMDATAAFARLRDEYQGRIDALFEALTSRGSGSGSGVGIDVERDRAIVRDLLALAPPGIDELYALSILGDALYDGRIARIIVDPAPTGHLLRLLDMPALALDWSHRLMRLMLQYRELVSLGETAQELLDFTKRTRALETLLHDPSRCGMAIVSLDEPVVRAETERLVAEVRTRGIGVTGVVWNRMRARAAPLPQLAAVSQVCAEEVVPPPIGVAALREWSGTWAVLPNS